MMGPGVNLQKSQTRLMPLPPVAWAWMGVRKKKSCTPALEAVTEVLKKC